MTESVNGIARRAARRLADGGHDGLPAEVEAYLAAGGPTRPTGYIEPVTVSLAGLVVSIATLAWTIFADLRKDGARPAAEVVRRRVRVTVETPPSVPHETRDRIIEVVVEEVLNQEGGDDR